MLHFGPNSYWQLPFHHFWFEEQVGNPWGVGIVALLIQLQDRHNMAVTALTEHVARQAYAAKAASRPVSATNAELSAYRRCPVGNTGNTAPP